MQESTTPRLDKPIVDHIRRDLTPLHPSQTVGEALAQVRTRPPAGRIVYFYVTDDQNRLVGVVPTRRLLLSPLEAAIGSLMIDRLVTLQETATVLDACELFTLHKLLALPVVDSEKRFLGAVDVELYTGEVSDLAEKTNFDDLFQLIGVHADQAWKGSPLNAFRHRFPWLICNIVGGVLAAFVTGAYQGLLDQRIVLALFIPVVLALSESVGMQSASLAIQSIHGSATKWRRLGAALRRELGTGLLLGLASGPAVGLVAWLWKGEVRVGLTILGSITLAVTASALIGMSMPLVLHLLRRDPQVAAGPIALVAADLVTLGIYFNLGLWLLS